MHLIHCAAAAALSLGFALVTSPAWSDGHEEDANESRMQAKSFKGLEWRNLGPALMSGRIADLAIDPTDRATWYVAVGSGNVWKTVNAGTTWEPVFDDQGSYSTGCITLDPGRPDTVWLGTGENVGGRHVGYGDGVYRSLDGGESWENMGLAESEHIGMIVVDPRDSNVVYVAAQGPLWTPGGDRGLYKTVDGGTSWEKILGGGEYTGVNEVHMDPRDPDVLYATTHQRQRTVAALINGGPESGIHKSTDGGRTWREVTEGLPEEDMGKIGLAISPMKPDVVYATIELAHRKGGFWRSVDGGETWEKRSDHISGATGPHYYQEIFASPHEFDRVYQVSNQLHVTEDGGKTFVRVPEKNKHGDSHAMAFDPRDPDYLIVGTDGGLYESWDLGQTWKFVANLPVTQFYKVAVDYDEPYYNVYGGTQDNNTQGGPSQTNNVHGIRNSDWFITLFGDGHQPAVDPTNPDIVYSQWQQGNYVRHDRRNGEIVYIQPQPAEGEPTERFNWDAPILISPHDPATIFVASQRVWRSDDRGDSWEPISGDLSRGIDRLTQPMMGRVWSFDSLWDLYAMSKFGTVTSIAQSPLEEGLIYAGTDDGLIHVTQNGGRSWRRVGDLPQMPEFAYVNDIKADLHDPDTVYVAVDNHKEGDFAPYVYVSNNRGRSWRRINGDLPERHIVWRLVQDHVDPKLMFAGTEFGVFFTVDGGARWIKLEGGVPNIPFRDLAIQRREDDLVGATFGRGFFILDDYSPLREMSEEALERDVHLYPVRNTRWYVPRRPLGRGEKASQGDAFYVAPNPPFGAVFTYYLAADMQTRKERRLEAEKPVKEAGGNTPYPGWEALREEELEEEPAIVLTVRDADGEVVRRLSGPAKAGFHRVAWDLRYPDLEPWKPKDEDRWMPPIGPIAAPGVYSVGIARLVDGKHEEVGQRQTFSLEPIAEAALPGAPPREVVAFARRVEELQRVADGATAAIDEAVRRLDAIDQALMRSGADAQLGDRARRMERELKQLKERLKGNERRGVMNDQGPVSIDRRLDVAATSNRYSTYGPTPTHEASVGIAERQLRDLRGSLDRLLEAELPALESDLDAAGVPWTPGRGVPAP